MGKYHDSSGIGSYPDDGYDAIRDAEKVWRKNPEKYNSEKHYFDGTYNDYKSKYKGPTYGRTTQRRYNLREKVTVVVEHWSGCRGQSICDDMRQAIEDNFRADVKFVEFNNGRYDSFEVFIDGKLLYSRISQGGYPYVDEVLEAVWRARNGREFHELDRGSSSCTIL